MISLPIYQGFSFSVFPFPVSNYVVLIFHSILKVAISFVSYDPNFCYADDEDGGDEMDIDGDGTLILSVLRECLFMYVFVCLFALTDDYGDYGDIDEDLGAEDDDHSWKVIYVLCIGH